MKSFTENPCQRRSERVLCPWRAPLCARAGIAAMIASAGVTAPEAAAAQTLADYFLPVPVIDQLTSDG
ncbi:MAG TPA: hypothetical protein VFU02_22095, partial [Polyangiaceae bacterium]|nr:hypothetical protein [Polyangiaceae bacterium]